MTRAFVWFHRGSEKPTDTVTFYENRPGWRAPEGPPRMTMLTRGDGPFAAVMRRKGPVTGWAPYVQVEDVADATTRAVKRGAEVVEDQTRRPAGTYSVVRDPGRSARRALAEGVRPR